MILTELTSEFQFLNTLYSLILLIGLHQIGDFIFKINILKNIINEVSEIKYQKILISVNLILLIFYPIILFTNKINIIPYLSCSIFVLGIFNILKNLKKKFDFKSLHLKKIRSFEGIVLIVLFLLFLL